MAAQILGRNFRLVQSSEGDVFSFTVVLLVLGECPSPTDFLAEK